MFPGYLKLIVLKILSKKELSGYALIKQIEKETGFWRPSYGSIFPLLKQLEKEGNVKLVKEKNRNLYSLTQEGRLNLKLMTQKKNEIIDHLIDYCKIYQTISKDISDANFLMMVLGKVSKGEIPLKELQPELGMFRGIVFDIYNKNKIKGNERKIKKILRSAIENLEHIAKNGKEKG